MDLRELVKRIKKELEDEYEGIEVTDEYAGPMRVTLNLIWDGFEGLPENERQEKVWELLHAKFKYTDLKYVPYIITWTRAEKDAYDREHVTQNEAAREEWGWAPAYDLDAMTQDMLEKLKKKYEEGTLPEMG